ncbi:MAG: hypothetical protein ACLFPE_06795, partial [Bacteroidales bacterium]
MELYLPIAAVFFAAFFAPSLEKWFKSAVGWLLAIVPFLAFLHYLSMSLVIGTGQPFSSRLQWIPELGL